MKNDEFNNIGSEDNPKIEEFKRFDAIEYYQPKELVKFYDDNATPLESSAEIGKVEKTKKPDIDEVNKFTNNNTTSNNIQSSAGETSSGASPQAPQPVEGSNIADVAEIEAASAATASSGVTVAATSASLTGGVSVICSVVVVAATVASTVLGKAPKIVSYNFETGTDYIKYQINLSELNPEVDYSIRVTSNDYKEVFPVMEEGIQTQLLTGLNPNWKYEVSVIADGGDLGDYVYKTYEVYTMKLKKPEAVIKLTPNIDYELGTYNLDYETYISDYFHTGSDTYMEVWTAGVKILTDDNLNDESYFIGSIEDLLNELLVEAKVYTMYYGELTLVGSYEFETKYPIDFKPSTEIYRGTYDVKEPETIIKDNKLSLTIDTGFESKDPKDAYIIDIYEGEKDIHLTADTDKIPLYSFMGKDKVFTASIPIDVAKIDIYYTPIKILAEDNIKRFETTKIMSYKISDEIISEINPTGVINVTENINKDEKTYNLDYEVNVTDKYEIGHDYNVKVLVDDKINSSVEMLEESVTSSILDLDNNSKVKIIVYYKNKEDEAIILEEKEVIVEYPIDFISHKETYKSTYELEFSSTLGDDGFNFNINTNFIASDTKDYYIIDIYNGNELIDSKESNKKELSLVIPYDISEINLTLKEIKRTGTYFSEYEKKEYSYSFEETRSKADNPVGVITVTDDIDTENEIYNVDYKVEVTDLYKKGSNYKLVIRVGDKDPEEIVLDSYSYESKLEDLANDTLIKFELFATINDEEILVESKEKEIVYADDFITYNATYEINEDKITSSFDASKGFDININSSFSYNGSENEKYIIRVYNGYELIEEKISDEESVLVTIPSDIEGVDIHFIPVKIRTSGDKEFEESVIHYDLIPFKNIKLNMNKENVALSMDLADIESAFDLAYEITLNSGEVVNGTSRFTQKLEETINQESKDIASIKVNISYQDKLIRSYTFNNDSSSELGEYEVTEEGNIKIPTSITLPESYTFVSGSIVIDKGADVSAEIDLSDEIVISEITENTIGGMIYYSYKTTEGYTINKSEVISINLNAEIDVDYFASFVSSVFYANLDFKSILGDKEIDTDLDIEVYNQEQDKFVKLSSLERDAKFYKVKIISEIVNEVEVLEVKYKVKNSGFDNEEKTISFDPTMNANLSSMSGDLYNYTFNDPRYVKVENDDSTFNYYIDTGATLNNANLSLRIEGTYQDGGVTKYYYSPFITDNTYVIKNMTGNNFEFKIGIYYLSGGIYYRTESKTVKEFTASSAYIIREDSIYYDDATGSTNIDFQLNYDGIMSPQDITVKASGVSYQVELKSSSDLDTLGGSYSSENSNYSYQVTAQKDYEDNYNKWIISLTIKNKNITRATLTYVFYPESLIDKFDELAGVDLGGSQTQDIAIFRGTVDTDNINVTPTFDIYYGNKLTVKSDFTSPDYRDYLRYEILSNGEVIYSTFDGNQEAIVSFGSYYTLDNQNVTLRIKQVKEIGSNEIVYDTIYEEELTLEKHEIVTNQSVSVTASGYSYQAKIDSDYKDEIIQADVIEYYSDGTTNEEEIDVTVSGNDLSIDVDHSSDDVMTKLTKVEVRVRVTASPYSSGNLVSVYSYEIE